MEEWQLPTKSEQLEPLSHINAFTLIFSHPLNKPKDRSINVSLQIFQALHCVNATDQTTLGGMDGDVLFGKEIKLASTLEDVIPLSLAKLGAGAWVQRLCQLQSLEVVGALTIDLLNCTWIRNGELVGRYADQRTVFLVQLYRFSM